MKRASWKLSLLQITVLALLPLLLGACALGPGQPPMPRTATQVSLVTTAIGRSFEKLDWPDFKGRKVVIHSGVPGESIGAPALTLDESYLRAAAEMRIMQAGGVVVEDEARANVVLNVVAHSIGLNRDTRFAGLKGVSGGGLIPITIPELAFYKRTYARGYADIEIGLADLKSRRLLHSSGPARGNTFFKRRVVMLFFQRKWTDLEDRNPESEDIEKKQ
ncbi:MAG: hypothetical protein JRH19_10600 [Deltaproteobacteria bacterium]|nr:hypothetical protein [Deltaproteobacteria bacterium]